MTETQRIERIESALFRWKLVCTLLGFVFAGISVWFVYDKLNPPTRIQARQLEIVNNEGTPVLKLSYGCSQEGWIWIGGRDGLVRCMVGEDPVDKLFKLEMFGNGKQCASLSVGNNGGLLAVADANGKGGAMVDMNEKNRGGRVRVFNYLGNSVGGIATDNNNCGVMGVCDANGNPTNGLMGPK